MGTKVDCKSYLPGYNSMRDLNEDSSSSSWPVSYGDKRTTNGPSYYNGFVPRTIIDCYPGYGKDALKQKMLEHEAVFKNQVYELHRLYRIQRDMMEEVKTKELHKLRASMEPSSSSSLRGSQMPFEDARKWHFPLLNSGYDRTSISGVEIENSPMSCTKGYNNTPPRHFLFQNGSSLKESEPSDLRPLKVRKKLFDLELPPEEYIDTEESEKLPEIKVSEISSYAPNGNLKVGAENRKPDSIGLADLNEPVEIEEAVARSTVDFLDHSSGNGGKYQPAKSNGGYLGVNEETLRIRDESLIKSSVESRANDKGWFSHLYEAGSSKSNHSSVTHSPQKEKMAIHSHPVPNSFFSSCFSNSWAQSTSSFTQKLTTAQSIEPFGGQKWQINASSKSNPCSGGELTTNGFFHGSAKVPSAGFNHLNCSRVDNIISDRSTNHVFGYFPKGSFNSKPVIDINLNEAEDKESNPEDHFSDLPWLKCKPNEAANKLCSKSEKVTDLNQPFDPNVTLGSSDSEILRKNGIAETQSVKKILGVPIFETGALKIAPSSVGCPSNVEKEKKTRIIDINLECVPDEEINAEEPNFVKENEEMKGAFVRDYIDLNSCVSDYEDIPSYESKADCVKKTFVIDLEVPVENEDENPSSQVLQNRNEMLQDEILRNAAETILSISTSCPDPDTISCPPNESLAESLIWFVDAISSCANGLETNEATVKDRISDKMDDFEAMTLQLQETKEEDYMPAPFVPEFQNPDETGPTTLSTRSRRGQSRRGRQRRDFQRDILPGLTTLSRHEVSEDIQTFGGLMRAMGHHWVSCLTRRNGPGRGRRRAVIENSPAPLVREICNIEGGLEDQSLRGWGKTTRRPRRQRCPTGNNNSHAVVLT